MSWDMSENAGCFCWWPYPVGELTNCFLTFWNAKLLKYNKISKYLALFWFAGLLYADKWIESQDSMYKVQNMSNFGNAYIWGTPPGHAL